MPKKIEIDVQWLREQIAADRSHKEIAAELGVHDATVERRCRKNGIRAARTGPKGGSRHFCWTGGVTDIGGYLYRHRPDHPHSTKAGYVLEHRLVMEEQLGRMLRPDEVVHHRNRDRKDNRPENLEVFSSNANHLRDELSGCAVHRLCVGCRMQREAILASLAGGAALPLPRCRRSRTGRAKLVRLACEQLRIPAPWWFDDFERRSKQPRRQPESGQPAVGQQTSQSSASG